MARVLRTVPLRGLKSGHKVNSTYMHVSWTLIAVALMVIKWKNIFDSRKTFLGIDCILNIDMFDGNCSRNYHILIIGLMGII